MLCYQQARLPYRDDDRDDEPVRPQPLPTTCARIACGRQIRAPHQFLCADHGAEALAAFRGYQASLRAGAEVTRR